MIILCHYGAKVFYSSMKDRKNNQVKRIFVYTGCYTIKRPVLINLGAQ